MCREQKFFICKHCGNMVGLIDNKGVPLVCCGEEMQELVPNTVDAAVEKHLPVVVKSENQITVTIGSVEHPMLAEHHIVFIYVETEHGGQRKCLDVSEKPTAIFQFAEDK
ncbi:MAG: desulfoferrodoxin family protein, partial [Ruthenibacterium sp.]